MEHRTKSVSGDLRSFANAFRETAEDIGMFVEIDNRTLDVVGMHNETLTRLSTLKQALSTCKAELINSELQDEDKYEPLLQLIEHYHHEVGSRLSGKLNRYH